tara:strand:- start:813 stop:968 length:156 start_codon:yes stop_codon:yes gene_type:complete
MPKKYSKNALIGGIKKEKSHYCNNSSLKFNILTYRGSILNAVIVLNYLNSG